MKKYLALLTLLSSVSAFAHGPGYYRPYYPQYHNHYNNNWVAPLIVGGIIGYGINRYNNPPPPQVIVQQQPVYIPPPVYQPNCTAWTETQNSDGTITRTRICQ